MFAQLALLLSAVLSAGDPPRSADPPPTPWHRELSNVQRLAPHETYERRLARDEDQWFEMPLAQGEFARLALDQASLDVRVTVFGPIPGPPSVYDGRWGGIEPVVLVANVSGVYQLEVQAVGKGRKGAYSIRLEEVRQGREEDHTSIELHLACTRAKQLVDAGKAPDLDEALRIYADSLTGWKGVGDRAGEAQSLNGMGYIYNWKGDTTAALQHYQAALEIRSALQSEHGIGETLHNMAALYSARGELHKALALYQQALVHRRKAPDLGGQAATLSNLGAVHIRLNEPEEAFADLEEARGISQAIGDRRGEGLAVFNLGSNYASLGMAHEAERYDQEALQAFRDESDLVGMASVYNNLGFIAQTLDNRPGNALASYREALGLFGTANHALGQTQALLNVGSCLALLHEPDQSAASYREALRLAESSGYRREMAAALEALGEIELTANRTDGARKNLTEAIALARAVGDPRVTASVLLGLARLEEKLDERIAARQAIEEALALVESVRTHIPGQQLEASYLALNRGYYEYYLGLLLGSGANPPDRDLAALALQISERSRARSLLDLLALAKIDLRRGIAPELKAREEALFSRLSSIQSELIHVQAGHNAAPERVALLEGGLREAEDEERALEEEIRRLHPYYAQIRYPMPLGLREVQSLLDPQTVLLEYFLAKDACYLFVVSREGIATYTLPKAAEIVPRVRKLLEALSRNDAGGFGAYALTARELYRILVQPAEAMLTSHQRLLVVPDGELYHLPFECLLTADPTSGALADYSRLSYLVKTWSIGYLPSASVLSSIRQAHLQPREPPRRGKEILIYADPETSRAPRSEGESARPAAAAYRGMLGEIGRLPRLKYSAAEANSIAALFASTDRVVFLGKDASEENVKFNPDLASARRLHFATHGILREDQPRYSGLVLAQNESSREDGLLQVYEIFNLPHLDNCDLVVLSACQTGVGTLLRGEALVGLVHSFFYAGAPSIVVSLSQVEDESTASLMTGFYRHLLQSGNKADGLRQAKQEMIRSRRWSHPRLWAPFVLVGEPN
jgi:CHAT domain-containing protein/Tfp pilus assembly protein PilF